MKKAFIRRTLFESLIENLSAIQKMCIYRELAETLEIKLSRFVEDDEMVSIWEDKIHEIIGREEVKKTLDSKMGKGELENFANIKTTERLLRKTGDLETSARN